METMMANWKPWQKSLLPAKTCVRAVPCRADESTNAAPTILTADVNHGQGSSELVGQ